MSRTRLVATSAVFAALYAVLGLVPVSPYLAGPAYLPLNKILAPVMGMLLGPLAAGLSLTIGTFLDVAYTGQARLPLGVFPLDFVPDLVVALAAWLAYTGRVKAALAVPIALLVLFVADPLSPVFIQVGPASVPFVWMHVLSVVCLAVALVLLKRDRLRTTSPVLLGAIALASLMAGQLAGTLIGQTLFVRINGIFNADAWRGGRMVLIFYAYPLERAFYTVASVLISVPLLRSLDKSRTRAPKST